MHPQRQPPEGAVPEPGVDVEIQREPKGGELAQADTAIDSLRAYPALVAAKDSALSRETARGDSLEVGLSAAGSALGRLYAARAADSARIGQLETQLAALPKPSRWRVRVLGVDVRPCKFAGLNIDERFAAGAGICVTP